MASRGGYAFGAELLVRVQQQDAVLGHDADDHDQSHKGCDVEVVSGDKQRENHAGNREHG